VVDVFIKLFLPQFLDVLKQLVVPVLRTDAKARVIEPKAQQLLTVSKEMLLDVSGPGLVRANVQKPFFHAFHYSLILKLLRLLEGSTGEMIGCVHARVRDDQGSVLRTRYPIALAPRIMQEDVTPE
jgi:hypothetical protein